MHVNDKHIPSSYDLNPLQQGAKQNEQGTIQGRTAFVIDGATHNTALAKSANSTNNQLVKIPSKNQSSIEAESLKATSLKTNPPIASAKFETILSNPHINEQFERMQQFGLSKERAGVMYNDKLVAGDSPELINADPSEIGPTYAIFEKENGRLALAVEADQAEYVHNQAHTYVDANGQIQRYDLVIIDPEISDEFKSIVDKFVETHIIPNLAPKEKLKTSNEDVKSQPSIKEKVTNIRDRILEINTNDQKIESKKEDKPLEQNLGVFAQIFGTLLKHVEVEKVKEKEEVELERMNLDKKHIIIQKSIKLFDLFQERVKARSESEAIALSEQNHMRASRFKPIEHANTTM